MKHLLAIFIILGLAPACANKDSDYSGTDASFTTLSVSSLSVGNNHNCVTSSYGTYCWGSNFANELGNGDYAHTTYPVKVLTPDSLTNVSAGGYYTCAVVSGGIKCWGQNTKGTLGTTSVNSEITATCNAANPCFSATPVSVEQVGGGAAISGISKIATTEEVACAVTTAGAALCWGDNYYGQLGNATTTSSETPVQVSTLTSGVTEIATGPGSHSCAIRNGAAYCWGENGEGQLGNNSTTDSTSPVAVSNLTSGVTAIDVGEEHTCAIQNGAAFCWGYNVLGAVGDSTTTNRLVPTAVTGLSSGVTAISVGESFTCAIVNGAARCWGLNLNGETGNGTSNVVVNFPVAVTGLTSGVTAIGAGEDHACAIMGTKVYCWGLNHLGQLGNGTNRSSALPVVVVDPVL
jgi:alpha-tubulin suppressor-like RCC1 family protein